MRVEDIGGRKGCSEDKYCRSGKPKPTEELTRMRTEGQTCSNCHLLQPAVTETKSSILSGGGIGLPDLLHQFNYNISVPPTTIYQGMNLYGDFKITWSPSLTFGNGSNATITPNGFRVAGSDNLNMSINKDSFQYGTTASISDDVNDIARSAGVSVSVPSLPQPWTARITTHQSLRAGGVLSYNDAVTFEFTARPDRVFLVAAIVPAGMAIYQAVLTGRVPSLQELCLGPCPGN